MGKPRKKNEEHPESPPSERMHKCIQATEAVFFAMHKCMLQAFMLTVQMEDSQGVLQFF